MFATHENNDSQKLGTRKTLFFRITSNKIQIRSAYSDQIRSEFISNRPFRSAYFSTVIRIGNLNVAIKHVENTCFKYNFTKLTFPTDKNNTTNLHYA